MIYEFEVFPYRPRRKHHRRTWADRLHALEVICIILAAWLAGASLMFGLAWMAWTVLR